MLRISDIIIEVKYLPTLSSVRTHPMPAWFDGAKFGIFIHWGLFSFPAYAPIRQGDINELFRTHSEEYVYANQPYAEWYWNSLRIPGSPVFQFHKKTYGENFGYEQFKEQFNQQIMSWDPQAWAQLFKQAGAKYVVLVSKHHDGFLLWSSKEDSPERGKDRLRSQDYFASRNIVKELGEAVRSVSLRMGYYYSGDLDWSFSAQPVLGVADLLTNGPATPEYIQTMERHWRELIYDYGADILWNDISFPPGSNLYALFADFYNQNPEGVVNDRWLQLPRILRGKAGYWVMKRILRLMNRKEGTSYPTIPHCDFRTAEYFSFPSIQKQKWEANRGIGNSFGFNQEENEQHYLNSNQVIRMLIDTVSKNGNLLLNIGPRADGSIPDAQLKTLEGVGNWLAVNGEAIFGSSPWKRFGDRLGKDTDCYYTCKDKIIYAFLMNTRSLTQAALPQISLFDDASIQVLGEGKPLEWKRDGTGVLIRLPDFEADQIPVLQITGVIND
jgi:alpha-L-fucosidase